MKLLVSPEDQPNKINTVSALLACPQRPDMKGRPSEADAPM
jgi:hypothetical protein